MSKVLSWTTSSKGTSSTRRRGPEGSSSPNFSNLSTATSEILNVINSCSRLPGDLILNWRQKVNAAVMDVGSSLLFSITEYMESLEQRWWSLVDGHLWHSLLTLLWHRPAILVSWKQKSGLLGAHSLDGKRRRSSLSSLDHQPARSVTPSINLPVQSKTALLHRTMRQHRIIKCNTGAQCF